MNTHTVTWHAITAPGAHCLRILPEQVRQREKTSRNFYGPLLYLLESASQKRCVNECVCKGMRCDTLWARFIFYRHLGRFLVRKCGCLCFWFCLYVCVSLGLCMLQLLATTTMERDGKHSGRVFKVNIFMYIYKWEKCIYIYISGKTKKTTGIIF